MYSLPGYSASPSGTSVWTIAAAVAAESTAKAGAIMTLVVARTATMPATVAARLVAFLMFPSFPSALESRAAARRFLLSSSFSCPFY